MTIAFYIFAAIALAASLGVVGQRNPMYSVMLLIVSFGALAGLYVLLDAPFIAVTQIIIYAGAIMVLFLFVVMLLNAKREDAAPPASFSAVLGPTGMRVGAVLSVIFGAQIIWVIARLGTGYFVEGEAAAEISSVALIGRTLFTRHAFAFEAAGILMLVAMLGAVVIARRAR
jgi:NADH-quinone oxidoreductase subunit J